LAPEVYSELAGSRSGAIAVRILDSTDPAAVRSAAEWADPAETLFIVASKSGGTIEVRSFEAYFWELARAQLGSRVGEHFIAITDEATALARLAAEKGYLRTFTNPGDIGGRFSALSLFGLVPAALLGLDLDRMLTGAREMADACRANDEQNPGLALGAFIAESAAAGRDKLTLLLTPALEPLGAWIEQLVAESTGKDGRGVLPVVGEPVGKVAEYGPDRAFVGVFSPEEETLPGVLSEFKRAGHAAFRIDASAEALGLEFFRWEFATAVAGAALGVNPFDEPNVRDAKQRTQAQLDRRRTRGSFSIMPPFEQGKGYSRRESRRADDGTPPKAGRYIAILDYLPADPRRTEMVGRLRAALRRRAGTATTHGLGPRYLHSTGQYHKGGPNSGVFLMMTAADPGVTPIPGTDFSFSTLKQAQALGDFEALAASGRHVVHYHIDDPLSDYAQELERVLRSFG
jgi:hypothetical protein